MKKVGIINYGVGNYKSVSKAIHLSGGEPYDISNIDDLKGIQAVILPGVGHYKAALSKMRETDLDKAIQDLYGSKIPVLGICLGLHLMGISSEEATDQEGLKIFDFNVFENLKSKVNTGWLDVLDKNKNIHNKYYFNHGYHIKVLPNTVLTSQSKKIVNDFSAAVKSENFLGVQFHVEKSGINGIDFMRKIFE